MEAGKKLKQPLRHGVGEDFNREKISIVKRKYFRQT